MTTANVVNMVMGDSKQVEPALGMGATRLMYTDRKPCTIISILRTQKGKVIGVEVQEDNATRTDANGMSESQTYEYTPNPEGARHIYTLRRNGAYVRKDSPTDKGERIAIGHREKFHDYTF